MGGERSTEWRLVGASMWAGAAYDLVFAVAILFFSRPAAGLLGLDRPDDPVYLGLNGILLMLLAGLYLLPALEPRRYRTVVAVAAGGRLLGFAYLLWAFAGGRPRAFLALALGDLFFALLHTLLLYRARERS